MVNEELAARLKAFALMLKYGHDLFGAKDFNDAAALAVSNSRSLLNFRTATLLELSGGKSRVIAQYGQVEVNPHSRLAVLQNKLAESLNFGDEPLIVTGENGLGAELAQHDAVYFCLKLTPPANAAETDFVFVWLLEYEKEVPGFVANTAKLLGSSIAEALYYQRLCKSRLTGVRRQVKKRWMWAAVLLLLTGAMFIRVPENATAEFTLKAPEITAAYAWFDGPIARCLAQDGDLVSKGEVIAEYDDAQLHYRLASARSGLREIEAELALEQQNAFIDQERLGKVKLLEARRDTVKVSVEEAEWYLEHSKVPAPADGILALADGRAERLAGKAVRTGDKLFEVFETSGMAAEIPVNERDASVLQQQFTVTLFLHTAPETAIPAQILDVSHYPEPTEQKTYCYMVRAKLPDNAGDLRYSMRGIARLSGGDVSLGYRLFKSVVLYFRGL